MKIRTDFVTNSSSSSYIICFARIADEERAKKIIDEFGIETYTSKEVEDEKHWGFLGADWAGVALYVDEILENYPDDKYIIIEDSNEGWERDWGDVVYDYDFEANEAIDSITEENGFTDIEVAEGEGRDG